jgi:hypothetical protein
MVAAAAGSGRQTEMTGPGAYRSCLSVRISLPLSLPQ